MGQEIESSEFSEADFEAFSRLLRQETRQLADWFSEARFSTSADKGGLELEAWLVDDDCRPASINQDFLARLGDPMVVPELAAFNVELNSHPQSLSGPGLRRMHEELSATWARSQTAASSLSARLAMIGILPTVSPEDLCLTHMTSMKRYRALNEQVLRMRGGEPLLLDIHGRDDLRMRHDDVMLESAATSFQIHLKTTMANSARVFNLSKIVSAPLVAISANSPFLFGRDLWAETRIPLFEQSVSVGGSDYSKRVTFGIRYAQDSVLECFEANLERYPVMLPMVDEDSDEPMHHLRLHNGTIWRWTRPLIGFDGDGTPHIRIEHRVVPAGPTTLDSIANAAFFFGLIYGLGDRTLEKEIPFEVARSNFYSAARNGLDADVDWTRGRRANVGELVMNELLPAAQEGLRSLQLDEIDIEHFLGIVEARVGCGQTGSVWQRRWVDRFGWSGNELARAYLECQDSGRPVHEWGFQC